MVNDESIDAFFIDEENKDIHFLQCKSCESEKSVKALKKEWLSYFDDIVAKLEDHTFIDNHKNNRIKEIAKEFILAKKKGYKSKLHFFHLGKGDKNILEHFEKITYYGWNKIKERYQEYLSKLDRTEPPEIEVKLFFEKLEPDVGNDHKTFVSVITGDELIRLREAYRYTLFDKNLRFSLGGNKINKEMINTAETEPENFYFYNNGITITSKGFKYKQNSSKVKIEFPQIINGAQTVDAIYSAYKDKENKLSRQNQVDSKNQARNEFRRIRVLFRIIQDDAKDGRKTSKFETKVIKYNNSQNSIRETDFYANNPEQIKLQELFSNFGYFYEIKRGDRKYLEDNPNYEHNLLKKKKTDFTYWSEKIDIEKFASLWMAYFHDPSSERTKKGNIFGHAGDKYYGLIFNEKEIQENHVKEMILAYNLFDSIVDQTEIYSNQIRKGMILNKLSLLCEGEDFYRKLNIFENIKEIVDHSFIFNDQLKQRFESKERFLKDKDSALNKVKEYAFFSNGKYLTLAIFRVILHKLEYTNPIIEQDLFKNKNFVKENIVKVWLPTILDDLIKKEYESFDNKRGSGIRSFYSTGQTFDNIQEHLNSLDIDKGQDFGDIFPLKLKV